MISASALIGALSRTAMLRMLTLATAAFTSLTAAGGDDARTDGAGRNRAPLPYDPKALAAARPRILIRGDVQAPGPEVDVGWPEIFGPVPSDVAMNEKPRSALADWLAAADNPLFARVWVNRIWMHHFGRGLLATPGNFGVGVAPPTHPELLDWLAAELIEHKFSTRHIHRLILKSDSYRLASQLVPANQNLDPDNETYWRWQPRRLEAEAIHDSILAVSGRLDPTVGGQSTPASKAGDSTRRSVYLFQDRNQPESFYRVFDGPTRVVSCSQRQTSTVAPQSLYLLNNKFIVDNARSLAERIVKAESTADGRIARAFETILNRRPDDEDLERSRDFLARYFAEDASASARGDSQFVRFCHALLNSSEFLYIP